MTTIVKTRNVHTNDSSVVALTGSASNIMEILTVNVDYTSSSTKGLRRVTLVVKDDSSNILYKVKAPHFTPEDSTKSYLFARGLEEDVQDICSHIQCTLPFGLVLLHNWTLEVVDDSNIADSEDDMTVTTIHRLIPSTSAEEVT
jgi:hypothetical protein